MYSRPTDRARARINIPDNYNGNAFSGINSLTPRYSDLKDEEIEDAAKEPQDNLQDRPITIYEEHSPPLPTPISLPKEEKKSTALASLLPTFVGSEAHFPFGHGIGHEELLIIAMMAMIFMAEGETDNELLLLLGLLLFAG